MVVVVVVAVVVAVVWTASTSLLSSFFPFSCVCICVFVKGKSLLGGGGGGGCGDVTAMTFPSRLPFAPVRVLSPSSSPSPTTRSITSPFSLLFSPFEGPTAALISPSSSSSSSSVASRSDFSGVAKGGASPSSADGFSGSISLISGSWVGESIGGEFAGALRLDGRDGDAVRGGLVGWWVFERADWTEDAGEDKKKRGLEVVRNWSFGVFFVLLRGYVVEVKGGVVRYSGKW